MGLIHINPTTTKAATMITVCFTVVQHSHYLFSTLFFCFPMPQCRNGFQHMPWSMGDGRQSIQRDLSSDHGTVLIMRGDHSPFVLNMAHMQMCSWQLISYPWWFQVELTPPIILNLANNWDPQFMNRSSTKPRFSRGYFILGEGIHDDQDGFRDFRWVSSEMSLNTTDSGHFFQSVLSILS